MLKVIFVIVIIFLIILYIVIPFFAIITSFVRPKDGYHTDEKIWKTFMEANKTGREFIMSKRPEEIFIKSFDGLKLSGLFVDKKSDKTVVFVHGYQSDGGLHDHGMTARYFDDKNYNLLYVDDRAHGNSEGNKIGFSILDYKDVLSWIDYLDKRLPDSKIVVYGISMGGATVVNVAGEKNLSSSVKGVIADCPFSSGYDEVKYLNSTRYHLPSSVLFMDDLFMKLICGYHLKDAEPKERIRNCKIPLLLIHGDKDRYVPTYMSEEIYDNATCPKKRVVVEGAKHASSYLINKDLYERSLEEFWLI